MGAELGRPLRQPLLADDLDRRQRRAGGDRVLLMGVMADRVAAGDVEIAAGDHRGDRQDAAAQRLAEHDHVRLHPVMLMGEEAPGLAEPGRDLVEDQERTVPVAGFAHALPEAGRRRIGRRPHRLGDDSRDVPLFRQHIGDHLGAGAGGVFEIVVAIGAVAVAPGRDMLGAGQQRPGNAGAEGRLAADAGGAEAGTVEGIPEGQGLEAAGRGAGEPQRHLDRIRAAGGEQYLAKIARRQQTERLGELDRRLAGEAARRKAEIVELLLDRLLEAGVPIADMVDAVAMEIHVAPPHRVLDPDAFRLGDGGEAGARQTLVQEGGGIARQQVARCLVADAGGPIAAGGRGVGFALGVDDRRCFGAHDKSRFTRPSGAIERRMAATERSEKSLIHILR